MGWIIEKITGRTLQEEIARVINNPAGMDLLLMEQAFQDPLMSPYFEVKGDILEKSEHWTWIKGDGGMTATSADLAKFPFYWSDQSIITQRSYDEMSTPVSLSDGIAIGYGLGVRNGIFADHKVIGHTGGHKSPISIMVYYPEHDLSVVVFVNTFYTSFHVRKLYGAVVHAYFDLPVPDFSNSAITLTEPEIYEGIFKAVDYQTATIRYNSEEQSLFYCFSDEMCQKMYPMGNHRFWIERWPYDFVEFDFDQNEKVQALREYYFGYYSALRKKVN